MKSFKRLQKNKIIVSEEINWDPNMKFLGLIYWHGQYSKLAFDFINFMVLIR